MKFSKKQARFKRAIKFRAKNKINNIERLCVHRTSKHIYAQIISTCGTRVLASASSVAAKIKNGSNVEAAVKVGELIGQAGKKIKISKVAFDRSGFKFHGRIKSLADAARNNGLNF